MGEKTVVGAWKREPIRCVDAVTCLFDWQVIFVGFIVYFLVHVINKIRKQRRKFVQFWNVLELVTVIMAILSCAMYGAKIMFGNTAMDILRESGSGERVVQLLYM